MHNQPKMIPGRHSTFFANGRSERQQVRGTIARGEYSDDSYLTTGLENGTEGKEMPYPATYTVLRRGQERFNIYCAPCHSRVGNGKGIVVSRGFSAAANLQSTRLREAPLGHYFYVMTHGYGSMPDYAEQITPVDRWAIAAYIRALQFSQRAPCKDVPKGVHVAHMDDLLRSAHLSQDFLDGWDAGEGDALGGPASPSRTGARHATRGDVGKGRAIYLKNCAVCHQASRKGLPPVFPSLLGIVDKDGEGKVRSVVKSGIPDAHPPMPPHPGLTESDMDNLIAFLRSR